MMDWQTDLLDLVEPYLASAEIGDLAYSGLTGQAINVKWFIEGWDEAVYGCKLYPGR